MCAYLCLYFSFFLHTLYFIICMCVRVYVRSTHTTILYCMYVFMCVRSCLCLFCDCCCCFSCVMSKMDLAQTILSDSFKSEFTNNAWHGVARPLARPLEVKSVRLSWRRCSGCSRVFSLEGVPEFLPAVLSRHWSFTLDDIHSGF